MDGLKYRHKSKTIVTFFPERCSFTVLFIFGKNELEIINRIKNKLSKPAIKPINETKQYHDGKWVWFRVENDDLTEDIFNLIKVKGNQPNRN